MTATNHVLTGAVIVAVVPNPAAALVLAFFSHILLDSMPHLGIKDPGKNLRMFCVVLFLDCSIAAAILLSIIFIQPIDWQLLVLGGILAASPDLLSIPLFISWLKHQPEKPFGLIQRFHNRLQWGERTWGWAIELPYAVLMGWLLISLV